MSLDWKVKDRAGLLRGNTRFPEDAAVLVAVLGEGATVWWSTRVKVWVEGENGVSAADSYDEAAEVMSRKLAEWAATMKASLSREV